MENIFSRPATPWRFTASTESISPPTVLAFRQVKVTSCFSEISTRKLSWLGLGGAFCFRQRFPRHRRVSVARRFRVFGISDVHTDWPENWEYLRQLPVGPFSNDALLLAGDVSHDMRQVLETLQLLKERFRHVFFVPGNHDLYVSGEKENMDSMEKHQRLLDECARLQVWTQPVHFQEEKLLIVPLFSWYHPEFDHEPDLPLASWPSRRHSRLALLGDEMECQWKDSRIPSGASVAAARNKCLAQLFDAMNDDAKVIQLGEDSASVPEQVISMSHFLPQPFLLPEKRFLFFPQLAQAAGSLYLQKRVAHLKPQIHLFGHTHFAWDQRHQEVRYVSAPLGSPKEWRLRPRSMRLEGGVPTLLWRGRGSIDCAPRAALWSDYYAEEPRRPEGPLGHWLQPRSGRRVRKVARLGTTAVTEQQGIASLVTVWDLQSVGTAQWKLLSDEERLRAEALAGSVDAQRRFVAMRAALRGILAERLGVRPVELRFRYGQYGKPELDAPWAQRRVSFSVSHSGEVGAILLLEMSDQRHGPAPAIGVDLEERRPRPFLRLAKRYFTIAEVQTLQKLKEEEQARCFFDMWTKKEAWLKTLGTGLAGGLTSLDAAESGDVEMTMVEAQEREEKLTYAVSTLTDTPLENHSVSVCLPKGTA